MPPRFPFTPFPTGWFRIAASQDVGRRGLQALKYFGQDLVLYRGEDGVARLLDAHCPHLGTHLGFGGKVVENAIQCPFHGWQIGEDGTCVAIPYTENIPAHTPIRAWPIREVNGQIMAWHDLAGRAPTWEPPEIPEFGALEWTPVRKGRHWIIRTHVQDLCENGMDSAHFPLLHSQQTKRMRTESVETNGPVFVHRTFQYYNVFGLAKSFVDEVSGPLDVTLNGLAFAINRARVDVKIQLHYTFAFYFTPIDEKRVEVIFFLAVRRLPVPFANAILLRKAIREGGHTIDQDIPIWENKRYRERPALCDGDGPILRYREWASQFYATDQGERERT